MRFPATNKLITSHPPIFALLRINTFLNYGWMYATARAIEERTCAVCMTATQFVPPILGVFSGTITMSPGRSAAFIGSPDHQPLLVLFEETTDPSARITNTPFLSAIGVKPPAWLKYHFADRPGWALIAVGLKTCPLT